MSLRDFFRRTRQRSGRRGYDREQAARLEHEELKRAQKRIRDRARSDKGFPSGGFPPARS